MKTLSILILFATLTVQADIYRWTDEDGNVIFSDEAKRGAQQIELSPATVYTPELSTQEKESMTSVETDDALPIEKLSPIPSYKLKIISPSDDESVWANDGNLTLNVFVEPALDIERGHTLTVEIDGTLVKAESGNSVVKLSNISRGTHTAIAYVVDTDGTVLNTSPSIQFHLHRATVKKQ